MQHADKPYHLAQIKAADAVRILMKLAAVHVIIKRIAVIVITAINAVIVVDRGDLLRLQLEAVLFHQLDR